MPTVIELTNATAKKHVTRFDTTAEDMPVENIYVARWWVAQEGGCEKGVRITIEPIK